MKNKIFKTMTLLVCIAAMLLGSVMMVQAEDMQEVITGEHSVTIRPQAQNAGYVYVNAQVPNGWGGEIRVNFHSQLSGKDHSCTMSYLENEYHSGLWLPAGTYQVEAELPQEDGLCQLALQDPSQALLQVKSGDNLYLNLVASEIPDETAAAEETSVPVIPPKEQQDYQDLPTPGDEPQTESAESTEVIDPEEEPESQTPLARFLRTLAAILVLVLIVVAVFCLIRQFRKEDSR